MALKRDKNDAVFSELVRERTNCEFHEYLNYKNGELIWRRRKPANGESIKSVNIFNSNYAGKKAGSLDKTGYIQIKIYGINRKAHRVIWEMHYGPIPVGMQIDHVNHIKNDNRIENLRLVNTKDNHRNMPRTKANKSGVNGVLWCDKYKKWRAFAGVDGRFMSLGYFLSKDKAIQKRDEFNKKNNFHPYHGG